MAMVKAYKGKKEIKVSRKSYENIFKKQGYKLADEPVKEERPIFEEEHVKGFGEVNNEEELDVESIPISDMNKEQLMHYAKEHNIDTKGAKSVADARRIIQTEVRKRREA